MTYTILGIGNPFYDRFAFVDDQFLVAQGLVKGDTALFDDKQQIDKAWDCIPKQTHEYEGKLGGSCANVIKVLAKLGNQCALCGKIGNDDDGKAILNKLNLTGITSLITQGSKGTGLVNCFVTPDCQRTMQTYLGAASELSEADIKNSLYEPVKHLHIEGYCAPFDNLLEKSINFAKEKSATISLDLSSMNIAKLFKARLQRCIPQIDFIFGNLSEIKELCNASTPQDALAQFTINQTVVATEGAHGCWVKAAGSKTAQHYNALKVEGVVDTTGAGDYFDAGFLHGLFMKKSIAECVDIANLAASYVIRVLGADFPDELWSELNARVLKAQSR